MSKAKDLGWAYKPKVRKFQNRAIRIAYVLGYKWDMWRPDKGPDIQSVSNECLRIEGESFAGENPTTGDVLNAYWTKHYGVAVPKLRKAKEEARKNKRKSDDLTFYQSWEWLKLRYEVLKTYGAVCMLCGTNHNLVVDHIKPRSKFPELEMEFNNLQVLCQYCNRGKSNDDYTDFRPKLPAPELNGEESEHMKSILQ